MAAGSPTGFLAGAAYNPGILQGANQGLGAISMGMQAGAQRQAQEMQQQALNLSRSAVDAFKNQDRAGFQTRLKELSAIDPKAAMDLQKTFGNLDWTNVVEAGYNIYAANASSDINAQNKLLDNASDILGPNHWGAQALQQIKAMPEGDDRNEELLGTLNMFKELGVFPKGTMAGGADKAKKQKTGAFLVEDDQGNKKIVAGVFDPATGGLQMAGANMPPGYKLISDLGETAQEQTQRRIEEAGGKEEVKKAIGMSQDLADRYIKINESLRTFDEGIAIIQEGLSKGENLGVGPIKKYFPKWNDAAARLENVANRMGLDVISSVTFGALSEAEMKKAMTTAMPSNLTGRDLLTWMQDKKAAQQKLADYLKEASLFIGSKRPDGGVNTVRDWMAKAPRGGTAQEAMPGTAPQPETRQEAMPQYTYNNPARPTTDADYEALAPGDHFIDPDDGQIYIK